MCLQSLNEAVELRFLRKHRSFELSVLALESNEITVVVVGSGASARVSGGIQDWHRRLMLARMSPPRFAVLKLAHL